MAVRCYRAHVDHPLHNQLCHDWILVKPNNQPETGNRKSCDPFRFTTNALTRPPCELYLRWYVHSPVICTSHSNVAIWGQLLDVTHKYWFNFNQKHSKINKLSHMYSEKSNYIFKNETIQTEKSQKSKSSL